MAGWYLIGLWGTYLTGIIMVVVGASVGRLQVRKLRVDTCFGLEKLTLVLEELP